MELCKSWTRYSWFVQELDSAWLLSELCTSLTRQSVWLNCVRVGIGMTEWSNEVSGLVRCDCESRIEAIKINGKIVNIFEGCTICYTLKMEV